MATQHSNQLSIPRSLAAFPFGHPRCSCLLMPAGATGRGPGAQAVRRWRMKSRCGLLERLWSAEISVDKSGSDGLTHRS